MREIAGGIWVLLIARGKATQKCCLSLFISSDEYCDMIIDLNNLAIHDGAKIFQLCA
jgi:hypothetical protein